MNLQYRASRRWMSFVLLMFVFVSACSKKSGDTTGGTSDTKGGQKSAALSLIPAESNALVGINWKKFQTSPLAPEATKEIPDAMKPILETVDGAVIAMKIRPGESEPKDIVAVMSGKIDQNQLLDQLKKEGELTTGDYQGLKIYTKPQKDNFALAFVGDKVLFGVEAWVKKSIDISLGKADSIEKNANVSALLKNVDQGKMLWAVVEVPAGSIPAGDPNNPMAGLAKVKAIDLAVDYGTNLDIALDLLAASAADATQMKTMIDSFKNIFAASAAQENPLFGTIFNGIKIDAKDDKVMLALQLDKATLDQLIALSKGGSSQPATPPVGDSGAQPDAATSPQ